MRISKKTIFIAVIFIAANALVFSFNARLIKKTKLSQETALIERAWDFCVTGDQLFLIPDIKAGDVKIFEHSGKLSVILGRKGFGPGEFVKPSFCFYDGKERFGVLDLGLNKILIYQRQGKTDFKRIKEVYCLGGATDIQLIDDTLLVAGYKTAAPDDDYELYSIDLVTGQTAFLLPAYKKYGMQSVRDFKTRFLNKRDIQAIGIISYFDVCEDYAYFVWQGDLNIIRIDMKSGKASSFGKKSSHYIRPYASKQLLDGYKKGTFTIIQGERDKMSYIAGVFACPRYVMVIYTAPMTPVGDKNEANARMQFYTLDGSFLEDIPIPGKIGSRQYFLKEKETLYCLSSEMDDNLNEDYIILEYGISR